MHGVKRKVCSPAELATKAVKEQQIKAAYLNLLDQEKDLTVLARLVAINPDNGTWWNMRKQILQAQTAEEFNLTGELELTSSAIQANPKAYSSWFHRKWTLTHFFARSAEEEQKQKLLVQELDLCKLFLLKDDRNFHCWDYRRWKCVIKLQRLNPFCQPQNG